MERDKKGIPIISNERAYFHSDTYINIESTDVKELLAKVIKQILENISKYQKVGTGWYFKEVIRLEIHTVDYKPMRGGSSYIPLPDWIMRKKAIVSILTLIINVFFGLYFVIFIQEKRMIADWEISKSTKTNLIRKE